MPNTTDSLPESHFTSAAAQLRPAESGSASPRHATDPHALHRRSFLKRAGLFSVAAGLSGTGCANTTPAHAAPVTQAPAAGASRHAKARNVIFMVADGMSQGTFTLAHLARRMERQQEGTWYSLLSKPNVRRALMSTASASGMVTDSAAGGSAWGSGVHILNGCLNVTPDGRQTMPLLVQAAQAGKGTGLVTTTRVTHATPASFLTNSPSRELEDMIAAQMVQRGCDVVLGGGSAHVTDALLAQVKNAALVRDREQLLAATNAQSLWGIFSRQHVPFVLDREPKIPSLSEMASAALSVLDRKADGFVLQIEGGRVDHAAHSNDAASLVREQMEFDDTLAAVLRWLEGRDDTLLIITTDHGNANPGLTLYGAAGTPAMKRLLAAPHSFEWIEDRFKKSLKGVDPREQAWRNAAGTIVAEATGVELKEDERDMLSRVAAGERVMPFRTNNTWTGVLGAMLADHFGVSFVSGNHTADFVECTALGPGSEHLPPVIDNIDLHGLVTTTLAMPPGTMPEDMKALMEVKPAADE